MLEEKVIKRIDVAIIGSFSDVATVGALLDALSQRRYSYEIFDWDFSFQKCNEADERVIKMVPAWVSVFIVPSNASLSTIDTVALVAEQRRLIVTSTHENVFLVHEDDESPKSKAITPAFTWCEKSRYRPSEELLALVERLAESKVLGKNSSEQTSPEQAPMIHLWKPRIVRPISRTERRGESIPFAEIPAKDSLEGIRLQRLMAMDIAFQQQMRNQQELFPYLVNSRHKNGSGLQLSKQLRAYFVEFADRLASHGPDSLPSSFNIMAAFFRFNKQYFLFELLPEVEYVLSINDYLNWYQKTPLKMEPALVQSMVSEGVIYSYEMVSESNCFRILDSRSQVISGISFIRYGSGLYCMVLAGESPPFHTKDQISEMLENGGAIKRSEVSPAPGLTFDDRFLEGYPDHGKVILLTKLDLNSGEYDVRYVHIDGGKGYTVFTDDPVMIDGLMGYDDRDWKSIMEKNLAEYGKLLSLSRTLIFLPAFIATFGKNLSEMKVSTELFAKREERLNAATIKRLGEFACVSKRIFRGVPSGVSEDVELTAEVHPPGPDYETEGYWKPIGIQEIGEDRDGNAVVGQTWVSKLEQWTARSTQSVLLQKSSQQVCGSDPGVIYIQRSSANSLDVYKIGLTRRTPEVRAKELSSSSGVALPFAVLASWNVGECSLIEKEIHSRLAAYRINPRREFFHAGLSKLTSIIESVLKDFKS